MKRKVLSVLLAAAIVLALLPTFALAEPTKTYVNFGDSIAMGNIEADDPSYDKLRDGWSHQLARRLDAEWINYARRGMQTTDILYMLDEDFQKQVDEGIISPDSWHTVEYPPYDGTPLAEVRENVANADYISLCVGACDIISYPGDVQSAALESVPDKEALKAELEGLLQEKKLDKVTFDALTKLLYAYSKEAYINIKYVFDMLEGLRDYTEYVPQIVKSMRTMTESATIILIGTYIPAGTVQFFEETDDSGAIVYFLNRILDNINIVMKETAVKYNCVYVDTMGIHSDWHPTVEGQKQLCDRVYDVLQGKKEYAGNIALVHTVVTAIKDSIAKFVKEKLLVKKIIANILDLATKTIAFNA